MLHQHKSILPVKSFYSIKEHLIRVEEKEDGTLWVAEPETEYQINFCPICGYEAKQKITNTKKL